jgi:hypothetical protein
MGDDRKARIRAYTETPRPAGVYRVRNTRNGRALVGSSVDAPAILNRHRAQLRMGVHALRALQADWNELGAEAFEFEVLDILEPPAHDPGYDPREDLRVLEQMWLDKLSPFAERGYNERPKRRT